MHSTMLSLLVAAGIVLGVVDGCSMPAGWRPLSTTELVQQATDVLFAGVRRTFQDRPLYTAEVDVYCILKGQRTPPVVNITGVGFVPGMCISTSLEVGNTSLILASRQDNVYRVSRTYAIRWQQLADFAEICGVQKLYPLGVEEESARWICPTPAPPGECEDASDSTDDSD